MPRDDRAYLYQRAGQAGVAPDGTGLPGSDRAALQGTSLGRCALLTDDDRRALDAVATTPLRLRAGAEIVTEGVPTDRVHLLVEGWACRYKSTRDGSRQIIGLALPGDPCNVDSIVLPQVNFTVRTLTPAIVIGLPREGMRAVAAARPNVAAAFTFFAVLENAILNEWMTSVGRQSAIERVARFLCEMVARVDGPRGEMAVIELPVTQEQIADALGLTGVHVNRMIQQLRRDALIAVDRRRITLLDMARLQRLGEFDGAYLHAAASPATERAMAR